MYIYSVQAELHDGMIIIKQFGVSVEDAHNNAKLTFDRILNVSFEIVEIKREYFD